jgi:hypothetical protein
MQMTGQSAGTIAGSPALVKGDRPPSVTAVT